MSRMLSVNLENYTIDDDIRQTIQASLSFCICCLDKESGFVKVTNCTHAAYLDNFIRPEINAVEQLICVHCHALLVRIDGFNRQVAETFRILSDHGNIPTWESGHIRAAILNRSDISRVIVEEDHELLKKDLQIISEPIVTIHEGPQTSELSNLNNAPTKKKVVKSKEAKVIEHKPQKKQAKEPLYKKFAGKIRRVQLEEEEMLEERRKEMENESYRKFPYKCESCIVGFDHEANYKDHVANKHTPHPGGVDCNICHSVLAAGSSYRKHVANHYTRYICEECGKKYITLYSILQHYNTEHETLDVIYKCQICSYITNQISAFTYHRNKHKDLKCPDCGKDSTSNANLKTHLFTVHKKSSRKYECDYCGKQYYTKSGLEHHIQTRHVNTSPPSDAFCVDCNVQFGSSRTYRAHLRLSLKHVNEEDKKHICSICDARFVTKTAYSRHVEWVHLKVYRHTCSNCDKVFRTPSLLKQHEDVVHKKIPLPKDKICQYCGRGFSTSGILRCHIRTHTGERPLKCKHCSATFAHGAALYTHNKIHKRKGDT